MNRSTSVLRWLTTTMIPKITMLVTMLITMLVTPISGPLGMGCGYAQAPDAVSVPKLVPKLVGRASCATATCHGGVLKSHESAAVWHSSASIWEAKDPHARAGARLKSLHSRLIVTNLVPATRSDDLLFRRVLVERCAACHAPEATELPLNDENIDKKLTSGVGCESCHGAAEHWITAHTQRDWIPQSAYALALGQRDTQTMTSRINDCTRCHIGSRTADGLVRDVNHDLLAAGHPRMLFDPSVMEARLPPHWRTTVGSPMHTPADQQGPHQALARSVVASALERLIAERRSSSDKLPRPEFSEFNCQSCHRQLSGGAQ